MGHDNQSYYSVADLVALGLPGFPVTRQGVDALVKRDSWPYREAKGYGGPGGVKREYRPPPEVQALIDPAQKARMAAMGETPEIKSARAAAIRAAIGDTPELNKLKADAIRRAAGGEGVKDNHLGANPAPAKPAEPPSDSFDSQRDMLEAILRVGEYRISHHQVTQNVISAVREGAPHWLVSVARYPDLEVRFRSMISAIEFLAATDIGQLSSKGSNA